MKYILPILLSFLLFTGNVTANIESTPCKRSVRIPENMSWKDISHSKYAGKIWIIKHKHDLKGADVVIPGKVTLRFIGGSLNNFKSIKGDKTEIDSPERQIFDMSGRFKGSWDARFVPEWFGAKGDNKTDDSKAIAYLFSKFKEIYLPSKYYVKNLRVTIKQAIEIAGSEGSLIRGNKSVSNHIYLQNSLDMSHVKMQDFRYAFLINHQDTIDHIIVHHCEFTGIKDGVLYASNTNFGLRILKFNFHNNEIHDCSNGLNTMGGILSADIYDNVITNIGNLETNQGQAIGIRIGNSSLDWASDKSLGHVYIHDNRIKNVFSGQYIKRGEGYECHGITASGNDIRIVDNLIENQCNNGCSLGKDIKTGSEGIYVKGADVLIEGNTLLNAGYGEGAICVKGARQNVIIKNNKVVHDAILGRSTVAFHVGAYKYAEISGNEAVMQDSAGVGFYVSTSKEVETTVVIKDNPMVSVKGFGIRLVNQFKSNHLIIENNHILARNDFIKEESNAPYKLSFEDNHVEIRGYPRLFGFFIPSTKMQSESVIRKNTFVNRGAGEINYVRDLGEVTHNRFIIHSSSHNPLVIIQNQARFDHNTIEYKGDWRYLLMISNSDNKIEVRNNTFDCTAAKDGCERIISVNITKPNEVTLSGNKFKDSPRHHADYCIGASGNKTIKKLTIEDNYADKYCHSFLDVSISVEEAHIFSNKTYCTHSFIGKAQLSRINKLKTFGNNQFVE